MENRRTYSTPFHAVETEVVCSRGKAIVVAQSPEIAKFVVLACNRYDRLMAAYDLCRGEMDGHTLPYRFPGQKKFAEISADLQADFEKNGR